MRKSIIYLSFFAFLCLFNKKMSYQHLIKPLLTKSVLKLNVINNFYSEKKFYV